MRWTPSFNYGPGHALSAELSLPVAVWTHGGWTVGNTRRVASGLPFPSITQRYHQLGITLRFRDTEWPLVRQILAWGQTGASLLWHPGDISLHQIEESVEVFMDAPRMRDVLRPTRDGTMPWLMTYRIVLRRADGAAWSLQYFREPPAVALAATDITYDSFTANWTPFVGASGYELDVSTSEDFTTGVITYPAGENETSLAVDGVIPETDYFYRVRALYRNPPFPDTPVSNVITVHTAVLVWLEDLFNTGAQASLQTHVGDSAVVWTRHVSYLTGGNMMVETTGVLTGRTPTPPSGSVSAYISDAASEPDSDDYRTFIGLIEKTTELRNDAGVMVRFATGTNTGILFWFNRTATPDRMELYAMPAGTLLWNLNQALTLNTPHEIEVRVIGNKVFVFFDGVEKTPAGGVTVTTLVGRRVGPRFYNFFDQTSANGLQMTHIKVMAL